MAEKETEFKYLLSSSDYQKVVGALGAPYAERAFVNRYLTVDGGSDRRDWVLRLRVDGDRRELTLKVGREIAPGVFDSVEYNEAVDSESPQEWEGTEPIRVLRAEVSQAPVVVQGESVNRRLLFRPAVEVGRVWEVDYCRLPNGHDFYELEVEVESAGPDQGQRLADWLQSLGVRPAPSEMTKYARFLASLDDH